MAACAGEASSNAAEAAREMSDPRSTRSEGRSGACCSCRRWAATLVDDARSRAVADDDPVRIIVSDTRSGRRTKAKKRKQNSRVGVITPCHVVYGTPWVRTPCDPYSAGRLCLRRRRREESASALCVRGDRQKFVHVAGSQPPRGGKTTPRRPTARPPPIPNATARAWRSSAPSRNMPSGPTPPKTRQTRGPPRQPRARPRRPRRCCRSSSTRRF